MTDTHDDDLRARLAALDPMADRPVTPLTATSKERAMTTTVETPAEPTPSRKRPVLLAAAASVAVAVAGVATALVVSGGSDEPAKRSVLSLRVPASDGTSMASCIMLSPEVLRGAVRAFEGTVTSVEGSTVTLDVARWFKGGTADVVEVTNTNSNTSLDGVVLETGKTYLVTSGESEIGSCSGTGEKSAELEAMFEQAFGG